MTTLKCITLTELKNRERKEYSFLNELSEIKYEYKKNGNIERAEALEDAVRYQRGRWGMMSDLIEELEAENE